MGAVAHGECQVCGSRAPVDMAARIAELEAALRCALHYIKRIGDDGEGGTSDHAVTLDAIQEALKKRTEFIQTAADTKTTLWPTNLDPTAWTEECRYRAAPDPTYPHYACEVPAVAWCVTHQCIPGAKPECPAPSVTAPVLQKSE